MSESATLSSVDSKSLCTSHKCPSCGAQERVTAERVIAGARSITRCHCRNCGHSWLPPGTDDDSDLNN